MQYSNICYIKLIYLNFLVFHCSIDLNNRNFKLFLSYNNENEFMIYKHIVY